jgi:hypothetical protein
VITCKIVHGPRVCYYGCVFISNTISLEEQRFALIFDSCNCEVNSCEVGHRFRVCDGFLIYTSRDRDVAGKIMNARVTGLWPEHSGPFLVQFLTEMERV